MANTRYGKTSPVRKTPASLADIIIRPVITEKATMLMEQNKYVFEVTRQSKKPEIKAAIESLFDVKVAKVNTMNLPPKKRRVGPIVGEKPRYKKAIVTLASGYSLKSVLFPEL